MRHTACRLKWKLEQYEVVSGEVGDAAWNAWKKVDFVGGSLG